MSDKQQIMNKKEKINDNVDFYEVNAIRLKSDYEMQSAYRELEYNHRNLISDYKTWAKEELHYSNLDTPKSAQKLRDCNDAYTLSMWMSCMAPLQEGFSVGSILSSWISFKAIDWVNPSFQADSARMLSNLRNELSPQISAFCDSHPSFKKSIDAFDSALAEKSTNLLQDEITRNIQVNGLDTMIMTPRQVAALKLNFTEQYYVDMRKYDPTKESDLNELAQLGESYEKALMHLNVIAHNGGFDMSVVAAEERYMVGLKIMENPEYANIFDETSDVYGAKPMVDGDDEYATWSGDFYTADGHKYSTGGNKYGAFTVRPIVSVDAKTDELERRAEQYSAMMYYLDSDDCPLPDKHKEFVKKEVKKSIEDYKQSTINMLADDGIPESTINDLIKDVFDESYDESLMSYEAGLSFTNKSFEDEMIHIVDKHCVQTLGLRYVDDFDDNSPERSNMLRKLEKKAANRYGSESRDGQTILKDMRLNYIETMSPAEVADLMFHVATNMEQGIMARGTYSRHCGDDATDKTLKEYAVNMDITDDNISSKKQREDAAADIITGDDNKDDKGLDDMGGKF